MKTKKQLTVLTILLLILATISACKTNCDCNSIDKSKKDGELLFKICKYIKDNNYPTEPGNPCKYEIREIKNDTLKGKDILRVKLSCCYMGDVAIIDKQTNEVIGFILSDK
jgi:hypothetical protein